MGQARVVIAIRRSARLYPASLRPTVLSESSAVRLSNAVVFLILILQKAQMSKHQHSNKCAFPLQRDFMSLKCKDLAA